MRKFHLIYAKIFFELLFKKQSEAVAELGPGSTGVGAVAMLGWDGGGVGMVAEIGTVAELGHYQKIGVSHLKLETNI